MDYLMKLKDGEILSVDYQSESYPGCPTCDYGSQYISDFDVKLTNYRIRIKASQMYEFVISEGDLMKLFLQNAEEIHNMTQESFGAWLREKITQIIRANLWCTIDEAERCRELEVKYEMERGANNG